MELVVPTADGEAIATTTAQGQVHTDKVWKSMDILYPVANVAGGFVLRHIYGLDGVE